MYDAISETLPNVLSLHMIHVVRITSFSLLLFSLLFVVVLVFKGVRVRRLYAITERTEQPIHRASWSAVTQWSSRGVAYPCRLISAFVVHEQINTHFFSRLGIALRKTYLMQ